MNKRSVGLILAIDAHGVVAYSTSKAAFNKHSYARFVKKLPPNRTIIADNVAFHKSEPVRTVAADRHLTLTFTPPYSPWFNPTEFAFSKVKAAYRRARLAGRADLVSDVRAAVGRLTADDCANFFRRAHDNVAFELRRAASA